MATTSSLRRAPAVRWQVAATVEPVSPVTDRFRRVNELIVEGLSRSPHEPVELFCECDDPDCYLVVPMSPAAYESLRRDPGWIALASEHPSRRAAAPAVGLASDGMRSALGGAASGHKHLVVLLDYWSVWLGGQYAAARGDAYVKAAEQLTEDVNDVIRSTATKSRSAYVDLRAAFKGPDYSYDETHYLSSDGDHPNAAGHERIAEATESVIEKTLRL